MLPIGAHIPRVSRAEMGIVSSPRICALSSESKSRSSVLSCCTKRTDKVAISMLIVRAWARATRRPCASPGSRSPARPYHSVDCCPDGDLVIGKPISFTHNVVDELQSLKLVAGKVGRRLRSNDVGPTARIERGTAGTAWFRDGWQHTRAIRLVQNDTQLVQSGVRAFAGPQTHDSPLEIVRQFSCQYDFVVIDLALQSEMFNHLFGTKSDTYADHDYGDFSGEFAPSMHGPWFMNFHVAPG